MFILFSLAAAPIVAIYTYFYLSDRHEREPLDLLIKSFFLGAFGLIPMAIIEGLFDGILGPQIGDGLMAQFLRAFIGASLIEEIGKYLILILYIYPKPEFDEPYDGIMYAVSIALGFAAIENLGYVFEHGMLVAWLRMFTAVPGHAMWAAMVGFYVGQAKFASSEDSVKLKRKGLFWAIIGHGLYDFGLFTKSGWGVLGALFLLLLQFLFCKKAMRYHNEVEIAQAVADTRPVGWVSGLPQGQSWPKPWTEERATPNKRLRIKHRADGRHLCAGAFHILSLILLASAVAICTGIIFAETFAVPERSQILIGAVLVVAFLEFIVFKLKQGSYAAWCCAVFISILLIPNLLFPLGLVSLGGLLHPNTRAALKRKDFKIS